MNPIVKRLDMNSAYDLDDYIPESAEVYKFFLTAGVGKGNSVGADDFQILLCSQKWLDREIASGRKVDERRIVVNFEYDPEKIRREVMRVIEEISGDNWDMVLEKLRMIGAWEFEDYI